MDEQEKVQNWISGMVGELNRLRRVQPAWVHQLQAQSNQQPPVFMAPSSSSLPAQASSSSASNVPVKAAPSSRNPSMASCSKNAAFPKVQGADPWADHKPRSQWMESITWLPQPERSRKVQFVQLSDSKALARRASSFVFSSLHVIHVHNALEGGVSCRATWTMISRGHCCAMAQGKREHLAD